MRAAAAEAIIMKYQKSHATLTSVVVVEEEGIACE
jgi:hypothetical protein